ncbi:MAG: class I SAM-dependent methyltransferase [Nitrospirae bacterium]|nr:MAG: class I SAM-dependent methyltransferase [Nitrospirota bacterium]
MSNESYLESHKAKDYGAKYDHLYRPGSYERKIWCLESEIIKNKIIKNKKIKKYLDFACGTGRLISVLESLAQESIGIDVSSSMLEQARKKLTKSTLIEINVLEDDSMDELFEECDLITAFRFFLNAEPKLQTQAIKKLSQYLAQDGILIFNIHGNKYSSYYFYVLIHNLIKNAFYKLTNKRPKIFSFKKCLSITDIKKLINDSNANLYIQNIYTYGHIPRMISKFMPFSVWLAMERKLTMKWHVAGSHIIIVCVPEKSLYRK